jgi:hypothetical protein
MSSRFYRGAKYHEPEYWKFGEDGNKYFRHATGQLYVVSKDLATYISINQYGSLKTICFAVDVGRAHHDGSFHVLQANIAQICE